MRGRGACKSPCCCMQIDRRKSLLIFKKKKKKKEICCQAKHSAQAVRQGVGEKAYFPFSIFSIFLLLYFRRRREQSEFHNYYLSHSCVFICIFSRQFSLQIFPHFHLFSACAFPLKVAQFSLVDFIFRRHIHTQPPLSPVLPCPFNMSMGHHKLRQHIVYGAYSAYRVHIVTGIC